MSQKLVHIARVYRGQTIESIHCGSAAIVDATGHLLYRVGDPNLWTFFRSSAKPFQAIPVVESGAAKRFEFTPAELAIICGSHSGEQYHVDTVRSILKKIGLDESYLHCGVHTPIIYTTLSKPVESDARFTSIYHNCSGKHSGMLAVAVHKGFPLENYLDFDHPVQQMITKAIAEICVYPEDQVPIGIDGCSAPAHAIPLYNMALGYARFISPNSVPKEKAKVYSTLSMAMMEHPEMVSGTARLDLVISTSPGEKIIAKGGAEAVICMAFVERSMGAAFKISDGNARAIHPAAVELLYKLGARTKTKELEEFHRPVIKNWRQIEVGFIEPGFDLVASE